MGLGQHTTDQIRELTTPHYPGSRNEEHRAQLVVLPEGDVAQGCDRPADVLVHQVEDSGARRQSGNGRRCVNAAP